MGLEYFKILYTRKKSFRFRIYIIIQSIFEGNRKVLYDTKILMEESKKLLYIWLIYDLLSNNIHKKLKEKIKRNLLLYKSF